MSEKFQNIPFPEYEQNIDKIMELYVQLRKRLLREIYRLTNLPQTPSVQEMIRQQQRILANVEAVFEQFRQEVGIVIPVVMLEAYVAGQALSMLATGSYKNIQAATAVAKSNVQSPAFKSTHAYRVHKLITDTQSDLLKATHNTEDNVKKMIREVVAKSMQEKAAVRYGRHEYTRQIKENLTRRLLEEKLEESEVAIIDKAGRRWKLDTYIEMVSRTKQMTAFIDAIRAEGLNNGVDLAIISTNPTTTDACKNFEGMIISLNGLTAGYPTYEELKRTKLIFHPNCRHFVRPVSSIDFVPKEYQEKHKKLLAKYEKWKNEQS